MIEFSKSYTLLSVKKKIGGLLSLIFRKHKLITAIFLLGIFLRLLGTYPGYPLTHPDEPTIATPSIRMVFEGNFKPQNYYYGSLLSLMYAGTYIVFFIPLSFIFILPLTPPNFLAGGPLGFFDYLQRGQPLHEQSFWSINYWARYDSAVLSSFTVLATYLLGRKLFNKPIGLISAALVAINYRHVLSSRLILADSPAALFALLAVFFFVKIIGKNNLKNYVLAGVGLGLALSVKYFVYIIPAFALSHFLTTFQINKTSFKQKIISLIFNYKPFLTIGIAIIIFFIINPYFILARDEALYFWSANAARYGLGNLSLDALTRNNLSYYSLYYLFNFGVGPILSALTLVGFIVSLIRYPKSTLIITSVALPFVYTFLVISGTGMVRNYSAIIPFVLFFPSVLVYEIVNLFLKKTNLHKFIVLQSAIYLLVLGLIGYQHIKYSLISGYHLSKEQNMIGLYDWISENMAIGDKVLGSSGIFYPTGIVEGVKLDVNRNNLLSSDEAKKSKIPWLIMSSIPAEITENLLLTNNLTRGLFFNSEKINELTSNHYNALIFNELADYRLVEFAKPLTQDPPFMVVKLPEEWSIKNDTEVFSDDFKKDPTSSWEESYYPNKSYEFSHSPKAGKAGNGSISIRQSAPHCTSIFTKLSSTKIEVTPNKWYSISILAQRKAAEIYKNTRSGFFRLDFYSKDNKLLKTYVTKPLSASTAWQNLLGAGLSPESSKYARAVFSLDTCLDGEEYIIDKVQLFAANDNPSIDWDKYKFYGKEPTLFGWLPQL